MDQHYVQTRNEAGELTYHISVPSAMRMAEIDRTIWKISWTQFSGERIRLAKKDGDWVYEPLRFKVEDVLEEIKENRS